MKAWFVQAPPAQLVVFSEVDRHDITRLRYNNFVRVDCKLVYIAGASAKAAHYPGATE